MMAKGKTRPESLLVRPPTQKLARADDHHLSLRLWLRLLTCTNQIENRIRQSLQARFEPTLPRFDLMAQLERTPED